MARDSVASERDLPQQSGESELCTEVRLVAQVSQDLFFSKGFLARYNLSSKNNVLAEASQFLIR